MKAKRVNPANWGTEIVNFESLPRQNHNDIILEVIEKSITLAYIVGVALGDGNLSCPNGRAVRLRISCDTKYPNIIKNIVTNLKNIFPNNKVSLCKHSSEHCIDVSVYSNKLNYIIPWTVGAGTKINQQAHVPTWIIENDQFSISCLRGLLQTDGSIYADRGYIMVNFTNLIKPLINDVYQMMSNLGFKPKIQSSLQKNGNVKYVVRLAKDVNHFIDKIELTKT